MVQTRLVFSKQSFLETTPEQFEQLWQTSCFGGFLISKQVLPKMVEQKQGTVIFTGATAALRAGDGFASFASAKFGLRALSQSLAREFGPKGVHVAHVVVDGGIWTPFAQKMWPDNEAKFIQPEAIADTYWNLHKQHQSTWTQELDIRPFAEKF
ncbi:hypothetical protein HDV00_011452 [Rhizophlyctis rosea]|nr:hypothetical protein HDV00_011452 [Rhizophlyctis rosea]